MKRYFDKAKLMDGLKHANKRDLVVETKVVVEEALFWYYFGIEYR